MKKVIIVLLVPFLSFCQLEKYEDFMPTSTGFVGHQSYYSFSFSEKHGCSEWVTYLSSKEMLSERNEDRNNMDFQTSVAPN